MGEGLRRARAAARATQRPAVERLCAAAIKRDGEVHERGFKSHWELRAALNPESVDYRHGLPGDVDGFVTTSGRFVDREEARAVALESGQIGPMWRNAGRSLLSSDISW